MNEPPLQTKSIEQRVFEHGEQLVKQRKHSDALNHFLPLLNLPLPPERRALVQNSVGRAYLDVGQIPQGIDYLNMALKTLPNSPDVLSNLALAYKWKGQLNIAMWYVEQALALNPWHNAAQFVQAMINLLSGRYLEGFRQYECRWRDPANNLKKPPADKPEWNGQNGKRVYIYGEQGAGDTILMLRYAKLIHEMGMEQVWVTQKGMRPLTETIRWIDQIVDIGEDYPEFDCMLPAMSLPRVFKTELHNIPPSPYLQKDIGFYPGQGFNVGIVWRGSTVQPNDAIRSTSLNLWKTILEIEGINFHCLQVDGAEECLFWPRIIEHERPQDWLETALRVIAMDLVISVDTSMVHLCGAMGVPCWCALHSRPYFVYPLHLDYCPWYSSVRLFKQKRDFEWQPVFEEIAKELRCLINR